MGKLLSSTAPAALALTLLLSGCSGGNPVKDAAKGVGLEAGDQGANDPATTATEEPPAAPIDSLVEDLTTPEGTSKAYLNYLLLGKASEACGLFTPEDIIRIFTTKDSCVTYVNDYAESVLYTFQDSLNVADNLVIRVNSQSDTLADVGVAVKANVQDSTSYYDRLDLVKQGETWLITNSDGLALTEQANGE